MTTDHEQVRAALERLSNDEAEELLALVRQIEWRRSDSASLRRLAADPSFNVPVPKDRAFQRIKPLVAAGRAASEILVEDRR
ncbi:MAG: hypothetical protein ACRDJE_13435 [Dehalococcoidia bacterium]